MKLRDWWKLRNEVGEPLTLEKLAEMVELTPQGLRLIMDGKGTTTATGARIVAATAGMVTWRDLVPAQSEVSDAS